MKDFFIGAGLVLLFVAGLSGLIASQVWAQQDRQEFADLCSKQGGRADFEGARQCIPLKECAK